MMMMMFGARELVESRPRQLLNIECGNQRLKLATPPIDRPTDRLFSFKLANASFIHSSYVNFTCDHWPEDRQAGRRRQKVITSLSQLISVLNCLLTIVPNVHKITAAHSLSVSLSLSLPSYHPSSKHRRAMDQHQHQV